VALIVDTGPLFASLDRDDDYHLACQRLLAETSEDLFIPAPVLVEVDYFVHQRLRLRSFEQLLYDIEIGAYTLVDLEPADYIRVREILTQYADSDIGFVDAAVLAIVERLNEPKLATLDHRHFRMLRPRHVPALELVP
jgi:predicted nucleic acid-binding protein